MPHGLKVGDRVIVAWKQVISRTEGARAEIVRKITAAGWVYAGYGDEKFRSCDGELPMYLFRLRAHGVGSYQTSLIADTPENRAIYDMPADAKVHVIYKKPREPRTKP